MKDIIIEKDKIVFFETDKLVIWKDAHQYIINDKTNRIQVKRGATFITRKDNLLWEICDCRELYERNAIELKPLIELLRTEPTMVGGSGERQITVRKEGKKRTLTKEQIKKMQAGRIKARKGK